jgi:hypothetical protein
MHATDSSLIVAFAAVIGGMVAYFVAFALLNLVRSQPPRHFDDTASDPQHDDVPAPSARPSRRRQHELPHPPLAESTPY